MARGYSLEKDLGFLINNPKYSDIEILCEDEKKLHACRAILAARSEVFDGLLYNGMKETYEIQIFFPKINSAEMEIILEYIYTGSIKEESLTKDNIFEAFNVADYFQLPDLQDFIIKIFKNKLKNDYNENYSPELLSKFVEKMPLTEDNILLNFLMEEVANIPLNTIDFGRLSIAGLRYLLYYTHEKEISFATPEYEVFRYSAILAAKQVSDDAYECLIGQLPTLELLELLENSNLEIIKKKPIVDRQKVAKKLKPLIEFIDFKRVQGQVLVDVIEPLEIVPSKIILNVYRYNTKSINPNIYIRGISTNYVWDRSGCGSGLITEENGKVVHAPFNLWRSVRAKMILENGLYEWDVIIERACKWSWIGVCASENFNYEDPAGRQLTGWVLGSGGYCRNSGVNIKNYCPSFGDGAKVTVHLDMSKKTCAFSVNGIKYPEVSGWNNLPSKLYPVVSLYYPGRFRIQPHKNNV
ncbi:hypothetical protein RclHR1_11830003 [Rhizophagus clarus]|uniref:BTB domain-containing protein n=1 Tax=Rhizophagus clarus TaxID=94130 RepID=A0A2Z6Q9S1_9GLOM|nr:hypothetical protein RclHR1_11830003 [Rhizophagus clarus]GES90075.1 hypothetical protein GLOIN_2v1472107 [Rhizophagus clarus]